MVMKDKLTKNNHKGSYYRARKISLASIISAFAFAIVAIPTYIKVSSLAEKKTKAEETIVEKVVVSHKKANFSAIYYED